MLSLTELPDFQSLSVAVVGDLIADHYLYARPRRLSREAPVMVLSHSGEEIGAGGAANVAKNLAALGAQVKTFGVVGRDASGRELIHVLERAGVDTSAVLTQPGWTTPTKTRVLAAEPRRNLRHVLRIDREPDGPVGEDVQREIASRVARAAEVADAVIISDYEYGAVSEPLAEVAQSLAGKGKIVVLDPRGKLAPFAGVTAVTPNMDELARFTGAAPDSLGDSQGLARAAADFLALAACRWLLVTRGNRGMALFGEGAPATGLEVEASGSEEITDVCGAGDTAAAVFALALASGVRASDAMLLANAASGVVVMEHGAAVCTRAALAEALGLDHEVRARGPRRTTTP